jgi:ATP/maltotriose-dependent transcriptional regulator MalT
MELIERDEFLALLQNHLRNIKQGEGHCVFLSGEAGIGKTSLVKMFCKLEKENCDIYQGACDALYTPRPLAPLYDIIWQISSSLWQGNHTIEERSDLFARFFRELKSKKETIVIIFEDIHWADEATLDFIKFFVRRIALIQCLFLVTYRDDEIHNAHPLRMVLGQLPPDSFSRMQLTPLSRTAVEKMSAEKGYKGEDVFQISRGNPFYVNEILASYSKGIPDNIRNAILSTYHGLDGKTRQIWDLLSVIPLSFEIKYLEKLEPLYASALENCLDRNILIITNGQIHFKHELFRLAIENSLSPLKRIELNKIILERFGESFGKDNQIERIIHHAKNANAYDIVVSHTPLAAKNAASVGAHVEAAKLYLTAIENYQDRNPEVLIGFYEGYAYECYLTNSIKEAIIYTGKSLKLWKELNNTEKIGNCLRFLSRLWWFEGNRDKAGYYAEQAIEVIDKEPSSTTKAMVFSNMSQLMMLADNFEKCIHWGGKAIAIAKEMNDDETMSHALNNVGSVKMKMPDYASEGAEMLNQSLQIALDHSYHEHAARAYTNLGSVSVSLRNYDRATQVLEEGINYCDERDLDSWTTYMSSWKSRLYFETGRWSEAYSLAEHLLENPKQPPIVKITALAVAARIKIRRGDEGALPLLKEAKTKAFETKELQRIIPVLTALLEYEWLTGNNSIEDEELETALRFINESDNIFDADEFSFWLEAAGKRKSPVGKKQHSALLWKQIGCPYEEALALFMEDENSKRNAITIMQTLGATAVCEKMKLEMRTSGIKNIPRGIRKTTSQNPAFLTGRELDILQLLKQGFQNKEIAGKLFISPKTVDHHISSILFKLDVNSRNKAVTEAKRLNIIS